MTRVRAPLPRPDGPLYLTDGGIETTLIFHEGLELPYFAAFALLRDAAGSAVLRKYYRGYGELACAYGTGLVLESPTWRASRDWAAKLGIGESELAELNRRALALLEELRSEFAGPRTPVLLSGCVGPRGDGYRPEQQLEPDEAQRYHAAQIDVFARCGADLVSAITMTHPGEAIGVARAARAAGLPVALSFTVETDGRLPSGEPLGQAIAAVDAALPGEVAYYMLNCAHPSHFASALAASAPWRERLLGVRANASRKSHAELDASPELDSGNPAQLAREYRQLLAELPWLRVFGGCCGTDTRHIEAIARACTR